MRPRTAIVAMLLTGFFLIGSGVTMIFLVEHCAGRRVDLVRVGEHVSIGQPIDEVVRMIESQSGTTVLKWSSSSRRIVVETPYEFGASNWILYIGLADGRVTSVHYRTADSDDFRPRHSPPDR